MHFIVVYVIIYIDSTCTFLQLCSSCMYIYGHQEYKCRPPDRQGVQLIIIMERSLILKALGTLSECV